MNPTNWLLLSNVSIALFISLYISSFNNTNPATIVKNTEKNEKTISWPW